MRQALRKVRDVVLGLMMLPMVSLMSLMAQTTTPPPQTFSATVYLDYRYFLSSAGPGHPQAGDRHLGLPQQPVRLPPGLLHL